MRPSVRPKKKGNYAFIDSQNLNVGVQKFGWKMDWAKFRKFLAETYNVTNAYMFIGYVPEFENLYEQLHSAGYMIVLKPTFDMTRPRPEDTKLTTETNKSANIKSVAGDKKDDDEKKTKGNVDADLVLWVMKELKAYNKAVIVSGDGDFYSLVEYLDQEHKLLKLLTPNAFYSNLYNKYDDYIERLDLHKKQLAYHDYKHRQKSSSSKHQPSHTNKHLKSTSRRIT
jgi:uncharacterized LabA/DUF88 family protein